ncbi:hypothetical protein OG864_34260 [Streptomyces sp. NBC_00124]|uniref:hypothetical protein n=1 Tax=Streptomyces sp. NBC_00124 TaxID=2975662 RepID=UPI00225B17DB|nr:hypothetical protein [Streptomyces sp. NBC_00124]MCX5363752.1 hypothetical protein [Streptomyces sp. NBC_00124]
MYARIVWWTGLALIAGAATLLGIHLIRYGLDSADKLASVFSIFIALVGLAMNLVGNAPTFSGMQLRREEQGPSAQGNTLLPGEIMTSGQSRISLSGAYRFIYQTDGNLVLYRRPGSHPMWDSKTAGRSTGKCIMQHDGNFVIYTGEGQAIGVSDTPGNPGSHLAVQDDGNVVVYRSDGTPIWATADRH